jgi:hypothetical protein
MKTDATLLRRFEEALLPADPGHSPVRSNLLGYGEISSIFELAENPGVAYKRMPLFKDREEAGKYEGQYHTYCSKLKEAGLQLPEDETIIIDGIPGRPVVLYIAQEKLPPEDFVHKKIHRQSEEENRRMIERVVAETLKVWQYNARLAPATELSLDGQLSNWVMNGDRLLFIDTSTPLFRIDGKEQLDPELLLQSAPGFLRWILRLFFLEDVMNRYYDLRLVLTDMAANLHKEQKPDLIPGTLEVINRLLPSDLPPLEQKEVDKYYREDKKIWSLFLAFRRFDRWVKTRLLRRRYEFILPGKIKR